MGLEKADEKHGVGKLPQLDSTPYHYFEKSPLSFFIADYNRLIATMGSQYRSARRCLRLWTVISGDVSAPTAFDPAMADMVTIQASISYSAFADPH